MTNLPNNYTYDYFSVSIEDRMALREAIDKTRMKGNYSFKLQQFKPDSWVYNCFHVHRLLMSKYEELISKGYFTSNTLSYRQFLIKYNKFYLENNSLWEDKIFWTVKKVLIKGDKTEDYFEEWLNKHEIIFERVKFGDERDKKGFDFIILIDGVSYKVQVKAAKFFKEGISVHFFYSEAKFISKANEYHILAMVNHKDKEVFLYKKNNLSDEIIKKIEKNENDNGRTVWVINKKYQMNLF